MKGVYAKGDTIKQQINSLDHTLQSFKRRLQKKVVGIVPPIPIFGYASQPDEDGTIFRAIIPAAGTITRLCMSVSEYMVKGQVSFSCGVERLSGRLYHDFTSRKPVVIEDTTVDVEAGDVLCIKADVGSVKGVAVSMLYRVNIPETQIHTAMIEELEKIEDGS